MLWWWAFVPQCVVVGGGDAYAVHCVFVPGCPLLYRYFVVAVHMMGW